MEKMTTNFSASYPQMGGITGYSSNHGVWSRMHQQQSNGPLKKKRKKWYQNFGANPVIYQISEREEDESSPLPLTTPDSAFSNSNSTMTSVSNVAHEDLCRELRNTASVPTVINEVEVSGNNLNDHKNTDIKHDESITKRQSSGTLEVPEVKQYAKSFYPPTKVIDYNTNKSHKSLEESCNYVTLQIPKTKQYAKSFYPPTKVREHDSIKLQKSFEKKQDGSTLKIPETNRSAKSFYPPLSETNLPSVKCLPISPDKNIQVPSSKEIVLKKIIDPPKYTHIRVPKIHNRRSQFEVSEDSPFYLPRLDNDIKIHLPKLENKVRKPITVTLSTNVQQARSLMKPRKIWNFRSLDDPLNFFATYQSVGTAEDDSGTSEHRDKSKTEETDHSELLGSANFHDVKDKENYEARIIKDNCHSVSQRKKWDHPDFWPGLYEGNVFHKVEKLELKSCIK